MSDDIINNVINKEDLKEGRFGLGDFMPGLDCIKQKLREEIKQQIEEWKSKGFIIDIKPPFMKREYTIQIGGLDDDVLLSDEEYLELRNSAKANKKRVYKGKPCKLGHTKRTVSTDNCSICAKQNSTRNKSTYTSTL